MAKYINLDKLNEILHNDKREAFSKHQVWLLLNYHPELIVEIGIDLTKIKNCEITEPKTEDNEYCQWINYDYRTICPKAHDVDNPYWRIPENLDKLKYCPYCGKEIKIIE